MPLKLKKRHGSPNWYVVGTVDGKLVDRSTKTSDRKIAEKIRTKLAFEIQQEAIHGAFAVATFGDAALMYLKAGKSGRFLPALLDHFKDSKLTTIDQAAIDFAAERLYPTATGATRNRQVYAPMSAILKFAAKRSWCRTFTVHRLPESEVRVRWLTHDEAVRLIEAAPAHLQLILLFLFHTGARVGEALKLEWPQVDLDAGVITFLDETTKSKRTRHVPITSALKQSLMAMPHKSGHVLRTHDGRPYASREAAGGQFKTAFRHACLRAGISKFRPHDIRHTWATWFYHSHRDLLALQKLGGWQSQSMVIRYAHPDVDRFAAMMEELPSLVTRQG